MPGQLAKLRNSFDEVAGAVAETLLPYLLRLVTWVNANMPTIQKVIQTTLDAVIAAINFLVPIIQKIIIGFQFLSDAAQKYWPQVQEAAEQVIAYYQEKVAPVIENVLSAVQAIWARFGGAITKIAKAAFDSVYLIVKTILGNLGSLIEAIMAAIRGDWGEAWTQLSEIPKRTLGAIVQILRNAITIFLTVAKALGKAIMDGLLAGLDAGWEKVKQMVSAIPGKIKGLLGNVGHLLYEAGKAILGGLLAGLTDKFEAIKTFISGIAGWIRDHKGPESKDKELLNNAGRLIIQGLEDGMRTQWTKLQGYVDGLSDDIADRYGKVVDAAIAAITDKQGALASAFDALASVALESFDKLSSDFQTKTQKKIARQDENRAAAARKAALDAARTAVTEASTPLVRKEGETDEDFAGRERDRLAALTAARQDEADAVFAIDRANDEKKGRCRTGRV